MMYRTLFNLIPSVVMSCLAVFIIRNQGDLVPLMTMFAPSNLLMKAGYFLVFATIALAFTLETWHTLGQLHDKLPQQEIQAIYGGTWFLMFLLFVAEFPNDDVLGLFLASIVYYVLLCVGMGNIVATAVCMVRRTAPA